MQQAKPRELQGHRKYQNKYLRAFWAELLSWGPTELGHFAVALCWALCSFSEPVISWVILNFNSLSGIIYTKHLALYVLDLLGTLQMVAIIIIIKIKISCVNIRTSDQIKENFSLMKTPAWCMLLIKCKRTFKTFGFNQQQCLQIVQGKWGAEKWGESHQRT